MKRGPRPGKSATLRTVARAAGVSVSTASRIINGTTRVSPELRRAVEVAIDKFQFRPNAAARGLALGRSRTIGIVTQAIDSPFYGECLRGIEHQLHQHGYLPMSMSGNWQEEEEIRCMHEFVARGVDGIIIFAGRLGDTALREQARRVPIVVTGRLLRGKGLFSLQSDDRRGATLAIEHLLSLGHRRVAFLAGTEGHVDASDRLAGYRDALAAAGLAFDPRLVVHGDWTEEGGVQAVFRLVASRVKFTGLLCVNDQSAYGAGLALYRKGLRVPDDVSVVGFDDLPGSSYRVPPLTSVRQSVRELGERSALAIVQLVNGQRARVSVPPVELVVRESTRGIGRRSTRATFSAVHVEEKLNRNVTS